MCLPRMTTRRLMIAVAVLAPVLAAAAWLIEVCWELEGFYGPGGKLDLQNQIGNEVAAGAEAHKQGDYREAEARYRSALKLIEVLSAKNAAHGWSPDTLGAFEVRIGLVDALAGQGRHVEAESQYKEALVACEKGFGPDHIAMAEFLDHYVASQRLRGNASVMDKLQAQAKTIREKWALSRRGR